MTLSRSGDTQPDFRSIEFPPAAYGRSVSSLDENIFGKAPSSRARSKRLSSPNGSTTKSGSPSGFDFDIHRDSFAACSNYLMKRQKALVGRGERDDRLISEDRKKLAKDI